MDYTRVVLPAVLSLALSAAVATPLATARSHGDVVAAAAASGRPSECLPTTGSVDESAANSIWHVARTPALRRYCQLIARAHARLETDAASAAEAARKADAILPKMAAPQVVLARAALRKGDVTGALQAFDRALALDRRSVEQPLALHDLARAQRKAGKLDDALASYRKLVPRASLLPSRSRRAQALLEAAHTAMTVAASSNADGNASRSLDEALAFLREAARDPHHALQLDVALSLVLALDRAGRSEQANAVLTEQRGTLAWARRAKPDYVASDADVHALRALALEANDRAAAVEAWRSFLASEGATFSERARQRLSQLETTSAKPRRRR